MQEIIYEIKIRNALIDYNTKLIQELTQELDKLHRDVSYLKERLNIELV